MPRIRSPLRAGLVSLCLVAGYAAGATSLAKDAPAMTPEDAIEVVRLWNERVARDGTAAVDQVADGCNHFVGSLGFQYIRDERALAARGVLHRTDDADDAAYTFGLLNKYADKNRDKLQGFALDYLPPQPGCKNYGVIISLRMTVPSGPEEGQIIDKLKELSRQAYLWDAEGYFMDAIMER